MLQVQSCKILISPFLSTWTQDEPHTVFDHLMCHPMSRTALKSIYAALDIKGIPKVMGNLWLKLVFEKKKRANPHNLINFDNKIVVASHSGGTQKG